MGMRAVDVNRFTQSDFKDLVEWTLEENFANGDVNQDTYHTYNSAIRITITRLRIL